MEFRSTLADESLEDKYYHVLRLSTRNKSGCGLYQLMAFVFVKLGILSAGFIVYGLTFWQMMPLFQCQDTASQLWYSCTRDEICLGQLQPQVAYQVDYTSEKSLKNWVQSLNLVCQPYYMIGFIGSSYFLGWAIFSIVLPQLANSWGRRPVVILTFLVQTTSIAGTLLNESLLTHLGIAFVLGLFASGRVAVSFIYLIELLTPEYARLVATFSSVLYVSFFALITAYLKFVSNDYAVITYTGVIFGLLSFLGVWCFLDESPLFLLRDGQYTKAEAIIRRMYEINGEDSRSKTRLSLSQDQKTIQSPIFDKADQALREADFRQFTTTPQPGALTQSLTRFLCSEFGRSINFILMVTLWSTIQFTYYQFNFSLRFLPGDIYINAFASALSEILGAIFGGLAYNLTQLNLSLLVSFSIAAFGAIMILRFEDPFWMPLWCLFARTGICAAYNIVYYGYQSMFPTAELQGSAMQACNLIARFVTVLAPLIAEMPGEFPMTVYFVLCVAGGTFAAVISSSGISLKQF